MNQYQFNSSFTALSMHDKNPQSHLFDDLPDCGIDIQTPNPMNMDFMAIPSSTDFQNFLFSHQQNQPHQVVEAQVEVDIVGGIKQPEQQIKEEDGEDDEIHWFLPIQSFSEKLTLVNPHNQKPQQFKRSFLNFSDEESSDDSFIVTPQQSFSQIKKKRL